MVVTGRGVQVDQAADAGRRSDAFVDAGDDGVGGYLYGLAKDGSIRWSTVIGQGFGSSLAVDSNGTIYFGRREDYLAAYSSDGAAKYQIRTQGAVYSSPEIVDGIIYMGGGNYLYAFGEKQ